MKHSSVILICGVFTFGIERPHVSGFQGAVGTHLNLMLQNGVGETVEEELIDCHVKGGDDFLLARANTTDLN